MNNTVYKPTAKGKHKLAEVDNCMRMGLVLLYTLGITLKVIDWGWKVYDEGDVDKPYTHDDVFWGIHPSYPNVSEQRFNEYIKDMLDMNLIEVVE